MYNPVYSPLFQVPSLGQYIRVEVGEERTNLTVTLYKLLDQQQDQLVFRYSRAQVISSSSPTVPAPPVPQSQLLQSHSHSSSSPTVPAPPVTAPPVHQSELLQSESQPSTQFQLLQSSPCL